MKKIIFCLILMMVLFTVNGCKKNHDASIPVRISYFDIRPQVINQNQTAWITLTLSDLDKDMVLVKALANYGLINPPISSTTGNPVYFEYFPPKIDAGETLQVVVTIQVTDLDGNELDQVEGRITVQDETNETL